MFHVKINNIHGKEFSAKFETRVDLDNWLQKHIEKENFGKNEREVIQENKPDNLEYKEIERYKLDPQTFEIVLDDLGLPVVEGFDYLVKYPKEYTIVITEAETELDAESYLILLRDNRDKILNLTDFTQLADCPISPEVKKIFREYREYLRDFTKGITKETVTRIKLESFHEFYRKKYIEVSRTIMNNTNNINDKILKILEK